MTTHRLNLAAAVLLAAACGERRVDLLLPAEIDPNDALIVVVSGGASKLRAFTAAEPLLLTEESEGSISLLHWRRTLESLSLEAGELQSAPAGCALVESFPPDQVWTANATPETPPLWTEASIGGLPAVARTFQLPDAACPRNPCPSWEVERFDLPQPTENPTWSIYPPEGPMLVGTVTNRVFRIELSAPVARGVPLVLEPEVDGLRAASIDEGGQIWLGGALRVARARLELDRLLLEPLAASPSGRTRVLGGVSSTTGVGLLAMTELGTVERHSGAEWQISSAALSVVPDDVAVRGSITPVSRSEFVVAWNRDRKILRYLDGVLRDETPEALMEGPAGAIHVEGFGTILVTGLRGQILHHDGTSWRILDEPASVAVRAVVPAEGGFLVVADNGQARLYLFGHGWCPSRRVFDSDIRVVERVEPDVYIVGGNTIDRPEGITTPMAVLRRVEPE